MHDLFDIEILSQRYTNYSVLAAARSHAGQYQQNRAERNGTERNGTERNGTEQNRTEQNRTEQNRTEQNRTEQNNLLFSKPPAVVQKICRCLPFSSRRMGRLYGAIALFVCLKGFVLGRNKSCLSYNEATQKCECCYSGLTGQDCKTECPNCGSSYVNNRCERFCQNASFYGTLCDKQCPTPCLRNGNCDESCATQFDSIKDERPSAERIPLNSQTVHGPASLGRIEGALITLAVCAVFIVAHITGMMKVCTKRLKALYGKCKSDKRTSAERIPLNPPTVHGEVSDSTTQPEVDGAPSSPADFLHSDSTMNVSIDSYTYLPTHPPTHPPTDSSRLVPEQPQGEEYGCVQISEPVAESEHDHDIDVHTGGAIQLGSYHGTAGAISNIV
ncbi:uncharacterized protein [Haliotis cracherodii]|uniref:uncharacterized protein n=1 Tax=Haliotis cracherodii TaxID=6455 RepID=UPI0039EC6043